MNKYQSLLFLVVCSWQLSVAQQKTTKYHRGEEPMGTTSLTQFVDPSLYPFYHGVASGDPLSDRIIIWTRVTPNTAGNIQVTWEMATDPQMRNIVKSGAAFTDQSKDYTVKVDVTGLAPGTTYYYHFMALGAGSLVGRTKTAPESSEHLKFAVVSCSNYQDGYFSAYRRIAERNDLDAVIHLGDYIYEYEDGDFGDFRPIEPQNEIVSLDDYRVRYSTYRLDPDLRTAHQQHPFITVWDDHEFANNAYKDGAENHQPATEGDWDVRKNNAWKTYFEWMPVRNVGGAANPYRIYRKISYGNLLDVLMLDTRIEARDQQDNSLLGLLANAGSELEAIAKKNTNERNSSANTEIKGVLNKYLPLFLNIKTGNARGGNDENMISESEFNFIIDKLGDYALAMDTDRQADFEKLNERDVEKVRGLIAKSVKSDRLVDKSNSRALANKNLLGANQFQWLENELSQSTAKWKLLGNQVLVAPVNGLTISDTWDGYESERERLLGFLDDENIENVAVVTGDIHTTFAADLPTSTFWYNLGVRNSAAVEFVTPSITSSNLDEFVGISDTFLSWLLTTLNPHVKEANLNDHGYLLLDVNEDRIQSDWYYIQDVEEENSPEQFGQSWYVNAGEQRLTQGSGPARMVASSLKEPAPASPVLPSGSKADELVVLSAYPNPAVTTAGINYVIQKEQNVTIRLFNIDGHLKKVVLNGVKQPGNYFTQIDVSDLNSGIYICRMEIEGKSVDIKFAVKR